MRNGGISPDCKHIHRREFLHVGSLAAGGVSLADLLRQRASARDAHNGTAVIQVFLGGGPSQHDTFDPKPPGPPECRPFDSIETAMPGVRVTEFFPRLAAIFDEFSVVRSVAHGDGSHNHSVHWLQTGHYPNKLVFGQNQFPATGAMIARYRGSQRPWCAAERRDTQPILLQHGFLSGSAL